MTRDSDSSPTRVTFLVTRTRTRVMINSDSDSDSDSTHRTRPIGLDPSDSDMGLGLNVCDSDSTAKIPIFTVCKIVFFKQCEQFCKVRHPEIDYKSCTKASAYNIVGIKRVFHGRQSWGGQGDTSPHVLKGGGHNIKCPPCF